MKNFKDFRSKKEKPSYSKNVEGFSLEIFKNNGRYEAYIDGDMLDSYKSQNDAMKAAQSFIKQYKD